MARFNSHARTVAVQVLAQEMAIQTHGSQYLVGGAPS